MQGKKTLDSVYGGRKAPPFSQLLAKNPDSAQNPTGWILGVNLPDGAGIAFRTSTSELRVQWHRVMAAVLALKPAFDSRYHRAKFVFDSAVRATHDWLRAVHHVGKEVSL
jgi:hypothetical protein